MNKDKYIKISDVTALLHQYRGYTINHALCREIIEALKDKSIDKLNIDEYLNNRRD